MMKVAEIVGMWMHVLDELVDMIQIRRMRGEGMGGLAVHVPVGLIQH